jgi:glucose/arabinose dehydrogenase
MVALDENGQATQAGLSPFIQGFSFKDGADQLNWGRPVDMVVAPDGALLISDDKAGAVYRVTYHASGAAAIQAY